MQRYSSALFSWDTSLDANANAPCLLAAVTYLIIFAATMTFARRS